MYNNKYKSIMSYDNHIKILRNIKLFNHLIRTRYFYERI